LVQRRNANIAAVAVAVANKPVLSEVEGTARTIWAMVTRGENYRAPLA
jgi:hypothetical protein